eukprot:TRINITY_DN8343_c0_g1_i1.p1 TRINITY_DN8343_c0_g1~~TRINITY_DN8343_c0_g1_i1.p1  ORF type:complete len:280 (+),score=65.45 TRINITY_DN8343_c0_g1_i1:72-911(+)
MRFKAKLSDHQRLYRVVHALEKVTKVCSIVIAPTTISFFVVGSITSELSVYAHVPVALICDEYRVESMNNNQIGFDLQLSHLSRALKSCSNAQEVNLRLTKKNGQPTIHMQIDILQQLQLMTVIQELPINLLPGVVTNDLQDPSWPPPDVYILMPRLRTIAKLVDSMKNLSDTITISANMSGELSLGIVTENVTLNTRFKDLEHPHLANASGPPHPPEDFFEVSIDIKKFSRFLACSEVDARHTICCLAEGKSVVFHLMSDDADAAEKLTYCLPALIDD